MRYLFIFMQPVPKKNIYIFASLITMYLGVSGVLTGKSYSSHSGLFGWVDMLLDYFFGHNGGNYFLILVGLYFLFLTFNKSGET